MRVLVTGGCGYVGSHAVRALTAAGHEAVIYDNLSTGHRRFSDGYRLIEADIADEAALALALLEVDAVMHFAASAYVGESVTYPRKYFRNNVEAGLKLLDAVLASRVRIFIFSSSCFGYRNSAAPKTGIRLHQNLDPQDAAGYLLCFVSDIFKDLTEEIQAIISGCFRRC
jgi:UDP-glucose 4-epimerase